MPPHCPSLPLRPWHGPHTPCPCPQDQLVLSLSSPLPSCPTHSSLAAPPYSRLHSLPLLHTHAQPPALFTRPPGTLPLPLLLHHPTPLGPQDKQAPKVLLYRFGDPQYFPQGVKHKYI